jgi:hypothetical protein
VEPFVKLSRGFSFQNSLVDLALEEGALQIGVSAFGWYYCLQPAVFPASLTGIEANALQPFGFAVWSQLRYIRSEVF